MQIEDWQKRRVLPNDKSMAIAGRTKNSSESFHGLSCWIHVPFAGCLSVPCPAVWSLHLWQIYHCFLVNNLAASRSLSCGTIIHHIHYCLLYLLVQNPLSQRRLMLPGFPTPSEDTRYFRITIRLAHEFSSNPLVFAIVLRDRSLFTRVEL